MPRLAGKTAIVTGGARGIGRHYSQALAAEGARVMIADIEDGGGLAKEIAQAHGAEAAASATFDVSDETAVEVLVARTLQRFGQIDILVNNAALYAKLRPRNFNEWDVATWDRVMAVNTRGPFLMVQARGAAHDGAALRQDHQHRLGRALQGRAAHAALRQLQGRHARFHALIVARTRRLRHRGQFAVARLYPQRHRAGERHPCRGGAPAGAQSAVHSSAMPIRKIWSARWYFWPQATAISSPASRSWWTAARSITSQGCPRAEDVAE